MYYKINKKYTSIIPAPSKYFLKIVGGNYDIDDFRDKFLNNNYEYNFILPPLIPILPILEEKKINIKQNSEQYNKYADNLILKRSKPIKKNNNSIEKAMNLQINY